MKNNLRHIYKAPQCTDLNDIEIAIEQVKKLDRCPSVIRRLNSLLRKRHSIEVLFLKKWRRDFYKTFSE